VLDAGQGEAAGVAEVLPGLVTPLTALPTPMLLQPSRVCYMQPGKVKPPVLQRQPAAGPVLAPVGGLPLVPLPAVDEPAGPALVLGHHEPGLHGLLAQQPVRAHGHLTQQPAAAIPVGRA